MRLLHLRLLERSRSPPGLDAIVKWLPDNAMPNTGVSTIENYLSEEIRPTLGESLLDSIIPDLGATQPNDWLGVTYNNGGKSVQGNFITNLIPSISTRSGGPVLWT